jgi:hypothetical protein
MTISRVIRRKDARSQKKYTGKFGEMKQKHYFSKEFA